MQILVLALLLSAQSQPADVAAAAETQATSEYDAEATAIVDDKKKICKETEPVTGSRIRRTKRVCRTASEWAEIERFSKEFIRGEQRGEVNTEIGAGVGGG